MTVKITNNGFSTLASGINDSATTVALASGEGARFPTLTTGNYFYGTLIDTSNNLEIVKVTARSTDSLTVVRAQDNTSARAFSTGDRFELRPVAKLFEDIQAEARDLNGAELVLDADGDTSITADTDDEIDFKTGGSDRMKVNGVGQVYIGTTVERNNSFVCIKSDATNQNGMEIRCYANNDAIRFYSSDSTSAGAVTVSGSSTTYSTSSDYRLKENVDYTFDATARLKQLKPCRFNWIADDTNTELDGFIAHEVSSIVPEAIIGTKDAEQMQGIDQSKLVPLLVKTIQEQQAVIEDLQSRVTTLEG